MSNEELSIYEIESVEPVEPSFLRVRLYDGLEGLVDIAPYLDGPVFRPLRRFKEFRRIRNGGFYVEWSCGADLSVDTLRYHLQKQLV